jgi:prepilin-type N-terminal cleavage/methylation domain-containing protein
MTATGSPAARRPQQAFTLVELLVVILIIGILASFAVPAMKGLGQANRTAAAHRQILDDLALARLRAINDRSPVYMVFVPPDMTPAFNRGVQNTNELKRLTNLVAEQFTGYALISSRSVGDQPGRPRPRYITEWRTLPEGMIFAHYKFAGTKPNIADEYSRTFPFSPAAVLPFPSTRSLPLSMPYIGFNAQGQLLSQRDEIITLAKGSVFVPRNRDGSIAVGPGAVPDIAYIPPVNLSRSPTTQTNTYQFVRINWLTGRAKVEIPEPQY